MNDVPRQFQSPNLWQRIPKAAAILALGLAVAAGVFFLKPSPQPRTPAPPAPQLVSVVYAQPQDQALAVKSQGEVAPRREIDLVVQVAGLVKSVNPSFVDGGFFEEGEVLFAIDPRDYRFALVRAEARVAEAEQALATEKGRARQAQREWRDLGNLEANDLFLRKPQLAAAEAQLEAAIADRDKAELDLERTQVKVPFTGRIRETSVNIGQYVTPGSRVARVYDSSVAEIRLPLTDNQAALLDLPLGFQRSDNNPGPAVVISGVIAGERYQWQGQIVRTEASIDTASRMYYAVAEVQDPFVERPPAVSGKQSQVPLVVGLFVDAEISGKEIADVVTLPRRALFKSNQVYTLAQDNSIRLKTVRVLQADRDNAWVKGDLAAGEPIVVGGQSFLQPGVIVSPQPVQELMAQRP